MNIEEYANYPLFNGIKILNDKMIKEDLPKIELNVIGGFALMFHNLRSKEGLTDIDYIGPNLNSSLKKIIDQMSKDYELPHDWINNDCLLPGTTLEDLEYTTGKLHFSEAFDLERIKVNILSTEDLLKMKIISIDTQLCSINTKEIMEFTRYKDFADISKLMTATNTSIEDIKKNPDVYKIVDTHTPHIIETYIDKGIKEVRNEIQKCLYQSYKTFEEDREKFKNTVYKRPPIVQEMLQKAINRAKEEDYPQL